jgi:rSAM/selenodomain-associated transferase 1
MDGFGHHNGRSERCAIAIMAKAPGAGRIKTRLSPLLSPQEANALGCCFLRDMTANLALAAKTVAIDPHVAFAPAGSEAAFDGLVAPGTGFVLADGSMPAPPGIAGFGTCLFQAACVLFAKGYGAVGLLNSDSPSLPTARLIEAARLLASPGERVVLGPAADGGYYLIGTKAPHAGLFRSIDWSTQRVAEQTKARAADLGLAVVELAPWYDVDDAASLRQLLQDLQRAARTGDAAYAAPATAGFLEANGIAERVATRLADAGM